MLGGGAIGLLVAMPSFSSAASSDTVPPTTAIVVTDDTATEDTTADTPSPPETPDAPPSDAERFPRIWPAERPLEMSEEEVLGRLNRALARTGGEPLDHYPELFSGLAEAVFTLPLFDPYDGERILPLVGPPMSTRVRQAGARGMALFCYLHETMQLSHWIIDGLAAAGGPGGRAAVGRSRGVFEGLRVRMGAVENRDATQTRAPLDRLR